MPYNGYDELFCMCTGPHTAGTTAHTYSLVSYATPLRICRNYASQPEMHRHGRRGKVLCAMDGA